MPDLYKYPRTRHIEGSRLQPGDEDLTAVQFAEISGKHLVVEEKIDGANCAVSFGPSRELRLQSRGHFLSGGPRERHFQLLKTWAACHQRAFGEVLGQRYVMYGEWVYAKHTIFYDALPHYFLEFDVLDTEEGAFLSTENRRELLAGLPVASVPVLRAGAFARLEELTGLVAKSLYMTESRWKRLDALSAEQGLSPERVRRETDPSDIAEGLYVKWEEDGRVVARYKWIRASFLTSVVDSGSHWLSRPIVPNQLAPGVDIYASD